MLAHFNELQLYGLEGNTLSYLNIGTRATDYNLTEVIDLALEPVIDLDGQQVVVGSVSLLDEFDNFFTLKSSQGLFRITVPLESARGRFLQFGIQHDTPYEFFIISSLVFIYRDTQSYKNKTHP